MEEFETLVENNPEDKSKVKNKIRYVDIVWFQILFCLGVASLYFIFRIINEDMCAELTEEIKKFYNTQTPEAVENALNIIREKIKLCFHLK